MLMSLALPALALSPDEDGKDPMSTYAITRGHHYVLYDASCDGTTQTWYYKCDHDNCNSYMTETHACRGKDHKGGCLWLPI